MRDLFGMEMYKLRKHKLTWASAIVCFAVSFILPILGKVFSHVLYSILAGANQTELLSEADRLIFEFDKPMAFSVLLRAPFGGLTLVLIFVFIAASSFLYLDIGGGYIKNIAGQLRSRGQSCYGKYAAVCIQALIFMICGFVGGVLGTLVSRGIYFDSEIAAGLLEFFLKWLVICGLDAVLLFFSAGIGSKALGIVFAVVFGTGSLAMIYMPLSFGVRMLFRLEYFDLSQYMPDQILSLVKINVWAALIGGAVLIAVFFPLTVSVLNKKDVK